MDAKTLTATSVEYDSETDILFASFGTHDSTLIDHEDSLSDGVYVQYSWPDVELAFMEIWKYSKRYGSLPITVDIGDDVLVVIPNILVTA
jgi:hypothetical protein